MGRTVATFTQMLDSYQQRWHKVRRALRQEDQIEWDRLFETARLHIQAGMYAAAPEPKESIYLTMMLVTWFSGEGYKHPIHEMAGKDPWLLLPEAADGRCA